MEKYSDMYDCFVLANKLRNNNIGKKMEFTSSIYQGILEGKYHMYPYGARRRPQLQKVKEDRWRQN